MPLRKFFLLTYMWHLCASPISIPAFGHLEGAGRNGLSPPPSHPISTTAAFPAIRCRCGMFISACALAAGLLRGIALPSRFHNGSVSRDSVPLRYHALEGADRSGFSPPPSRIRYKQTCPRSVPRRPCPGTPSGRCRRKCRLPGTFSFWYVASPHSFGRGCQVPAFSDSFGRSHRAFSGSVSLVGIVKPFSL